MTNGLHHVHVMKKKTGKKDHLIIDKLILFVAIMAPLMTVPQVLKIWVYQNATGVSLLSWASYLIFAFIWLSYGIAHKEKPIIITNVLWIIMKVFVVVGVWRYG